MGLMKELGEELYKLQRSALREDRYQAAHCFTLAEAEANRGHGKSNRELLQELSASYSAWLVAAESAEERAAWEACLAVVAAHRSQEK